MGLEHLRSIFAKGVGENPPELGGRHGGSWGDNLPHPPENSAFDDFSPFLQIKPGVRSPLTIKFERRTDEELPFPSNYKPINAIIDGEFKSLPNDSLKNHGWPDLYNREHTSKNPKSPSPRSSNPYQPFDYGNPNISGKLDIRGGNSPKSSLFSPSRNVLIGNKSEPYIISKIGSSGRRTNQGNRLIPPMRALTDVERIGSYLTSPAGLFELGMKNAHLGIASSVVRDGNKLVKVPQRFNAGYNPLAMLNGVGSRLLGQGVPNYLMKSGWTPGYGEDGGIFDIMEPPGSLPGYKLVNTFTDAGKDIDGNNVGKGNDSGGFFSLSGEVGRVSSGDRMTLAPMIKGTHLNHNSANTTAEGSTGTDTDITDLDFNLNSKKNGMPFYFKDLRDNSYIFFRAFLEGITEDISPSWAEHTYVGRSEPVYTYENTSRNISFTLKLHAQTRKELTAIYRKMNRLTSLCYPEYAKDEVLSDLLATKDADGNILKSITKTRMKPPLTKLRIGELYGNSTAENEGMLGFLESISYVVPEESTWETTVGVRVPKFVLATMTYKVIHGEVPSLYRGNSTEEYQFYGFNESLVDQAEQAEDNTQEEIKEVKKESESALKAKAEARAEMQKLRQQPDQNLSIG